MPRSNSERKGKCNYKRLRVLLQGENERVLHNIKSPYHELILFTVALVNQQDHKYKNNKGIFYRQTPVTSNRYLK